MRRERTWIAIAIVSLLINIGWVAYYWTFHKFKLKLKEEKSGKFYYLIYIPVSDKVCLFKYDVALIKNLEKLLKNYPKVKLICAVPKFMFNRFNCEEKIYIEELKIFDRSRLLIPNLLLLDENKYILSSFPVLFDNKDYMKNLFELFKILFKKLSEP